MCAQVIEPYSLFVTKDRYLIVHYICSSWKRGIPVMYASSETRTYRLQDCQYTIRASDEVVRGAVMAVLCAPFAIYSSLGQHNPEGIASLQRYRKAQNQPAVWRRESFTTEALLEHVGMIGATTCHHKMLEYTRKPAHLLKVCVHLEYM